VNVHTQRRLEALLSFERIGDPNTSLGTTLVVRWDGELVFEHCAIAGRRKKFLVERGDYIVKAAPTFRPGRLVSEGIVYDQLPAELRRHFCPPLAAGVADIQAPQPGGRTATEHVHWIVQPFVAGTDDVGYLDFKDRVIAAEAAGFLCHDANPGQLRRLPSGHIQWLDYELWDYTTNQKGSSQS
jgi:hypothetical protein